MGKAILMQSLKRKSSETLECGRTVVSKLNVNTDVATAATLPGTKAMLQAIGEIEMIMAFHRILIVLMIWLYRKICNKSTMNCFFYMILDRVHSEF